MKQIALLGMPNTGKSTFFNRLSGGNAKMGNWPGLTVTLMRTRILLGNEIVHLIDLPGIYVLRGYSDDEKIVREFLQKTELNLIVILINASQIDHQLPFVFQVRSLKIPTVLLLNMQDEAEHNGIQIDTKKLSQLTDIPSMQISAKKGLNCDKAMQIISQTISSNAHKAEITEDISTENYFTQAESIISNCVITPKVISKHLSETIDKILLHPVFGLPLFIIIMYGLFQTIFSVAKPIQDITSQLLQWIGIQVIKPIISFLPDILQGFMIEGLWGGVATVAAFIPVIILFFLMTSLVEDSGYFSRVVFLVDSLMTRLKLDGRSFIMILMGFGCNVPALMGTRIMRSQNLRLLTMFTIPFSLCSARLQVFLLMTSALFTPKEAPFVLFTLYGISFLAIALTAFLLKGHYPHQEPLIIELPPYRFPLIRHVLRRAYHEIYHFLQRATRFIIAGVVIIWGLTHFPTDVPAGSVKTWAGQIGEFLSPIFSSIGIDNFLSIALIFGLIAKEIVIGALSVIYGVQGEQLQTSLAEHINWVQAMSFMIFTLIYTPCISTIITLKNEAKSWKFALASIAWSLTLAWVASFLFYQITMTYFWKA